MNGNERRVSHMIDKSYAMHLHSFNIETDWRSIVLYMSG